ncbi:MAG: hypothetical protein IV100_24645 [Myxococcales bacterium]|nr:hypothetical protein [Myxococcales bacterium]
MPSSRDPDPPAEDHSGVDREQIRTLLAMTMRERLRSHDAALRSLLRLESRFRTRRAPPVDASAGPNPTSDEAP